MSINSLDDLRPGDIMIAGQNTAPSKLVIYGGEFLLHENFQIGKLVAGHAAIIVPGNKLVEAMPHGARIRDILPSDWCAEQAFVRLPEDYPGQALDAASIALAMVGTPYSIMSYVYLAAWRYGFTTTWLEKRINRRHQIKIQGMTRDLPQYWGLYEVPVEAICSVLVEQAWTLTGKEVIRGTAPQVATPSMLGIQLWARAGVIWGGAGIL